MSTATSSAPKSSSKSVQKIPPGMHTITPHLVCAGAAAAIEFYKKAFHATEGMRLQTPDGKIMHASVKIGDSVVMLVDAYPQMGNVDPLTLKGSPVTLHVYVEDADSFANNAIAAGAKVILPVQDMFWGDRYGVVQDPFGHNWSIATHVRDVSPEEMKQASAQGCPGA